MIRIIIVLKSKIYYIEITMKYFKNKIGTCENNTVI